MLVINTHLVPIFLFILFFTNVQGICPVVEKPLVPRGCSLQEFVDREGCKDFRLECSPISKGIRRRCNPMGTVKIPYGCVIKHYIIDYCPTFRIFCYESSEED